MKVKKNKRISHDDIPATSMVSLEQAKADFLKAGYDKTEVKNIISGLSELNKR